MKVRDMLALLSKQDPDKDVKVRDVGGNFVEVIRVRIPQDHDVAFADALTWQSVCEDPEGLKAFFAKERPVVIYT